MTYAVHVTVKDGNAQVSSQTVDDNAPPDGVYTISGSVNAVGESLGVSVNELPAAGRQAEDLRVRVRVRDGVSRC
jgi:hypothetical protein